MMTRTAVQAIFLGALIVFAAGGAPVFADDWTYMCTATTQGMNHVLQLKIVKGNVVAFHYMSANPSSGSDCAIAAERSGTIIKSDSVLKLESLQSEWIQQHDGILINAFDVSPKGKRFEDGSAFLQSDNGWYKLSIVAVKDVSYCAPTAGIATSVVLKVGHEECELGLPLTT